MAHSAWGARIDQLLADGEWHELEELLTAAARLVPPGMAYRKGEWNRLRRRASSSTTRVQGNRETSVATGARLIVRGVVHSRINRGTAERHGTRIRSTR